jgi:hypothetical protein
VAADASASGRPAAFFVCSGGGLSCVSIFSSSRNRVCFSVSSCGIIHGLSHTNLVRKSHDSSEYSCSLFIYLSGVGDVFNRVLLLDRALEVGGILKSIGTLVLKVEDHARGMARDGLSPQGILHLVNCAFLRVLYSLREIGVAFHVFI